jgi:hypothetical protein
LWPLRPIRRARSAAGIGGADHPGDHRRVATRHRGIHQGSTVISRRPSLTFSALTCWTSGTRRVDQRRELRITVVALVSYPKPQPADDHHREPPRRPQRQGCTT